MADHAPTVDPADGGAAIEAPGLKVTPGRNVRLASLRYFDVAGDFAAVIRAIAGVELPDVGQALTARADDRSLLAWRNPTETVLITTGGALIDELQRRAAAVTDGCVVEQTGGVAVLSLFGERVARLFHGIGGNASMPRLGEARAGRVAELPVLALCVRQQEILLLVERPYEAHLLGWMRACVS
jgi:hypothetical protein